MKKTLAKTALAALFAALLAAAAPAQETTVRLTSLEWPPYTGARLEEQGASAAVAKAAFAAMGYKLEIDFFPWSRAVDLAKTNPAYLGYFPEYYSADIAKEFRYSDPMGSGPLGFAQRTDNPITWNTLNDLQKYKIGVVQDYVNTPEFDRQVATGLIKVDTAISDELNLKKLGGGRFPLAVVDKNVLNYLLTNTPSLAPLKGQLEFNGKPLEDKKLYICFKKGGDADKMNQIFNEGLKKINIDQIMAKYLK